MIGLSCSPHLKIPRHPHEMYHSQTKARISTFSTPNGKDRMLSPHQRRLRTWGRNLGTRSKPCYREFTECQRLILYRISKMGLLYFDGKLELQERLIELAIEWSKLAGPDHLLNRNSLRVTLRLELTDR